ncbi:uncharacterized protein UTRI_03809 [Ustilago trichophora]|uniref:Uncharacterized protein n=1 Tax=Ustilago trichophora TaxID=86804 RepID=A0A5C3E361_9BASI|nr:uncharacterized protein UTRI_03809 [Ustilago trichophora]
MYRDPPLLSFAMSLPNPNAQEESRGCQLFTDGDEEWSEIAAEDLTDRFSRGERSVALNHFEYFALPLRLQPSMKNSTLTLGRTFAAYNAFAAQASILGNVSNNDATAGSSSAVQRLSSSHKYERGRLKDR